MVIVYSWLAAAGKNTVPFSACAFTVRPSRDHICASASQTTASPGTRLLVQVKSTSNPSG